MMEKLFDSFLKELNKKESAINDYKRYIRKNDFYIGTSSFWDTIEALMSGGFSVHAISLCNHQIQFILDKISQMNASDSKRASYQDYKTAFQWLRKFIENYFTLMNDNDPTFAISNLSDINSRIAKAFKIDGMEIFLDKSAKISFKEAIESIIFFSPKIISTHHDKIADQLLNNSINNQIPVRNSSRVKNGYYSINSNSYRVFTNHDGNKPVRDIIKDHTGYIVAQGIESSLHHYVISHIWSNATDPRYFTSMWNIALIPTWLNPVMDKKTTQGPLATRMKDTIKAICKKLYFSNIGSKGFSDIDIDKRPSVSKKIKGGEYNILILNPKLDNEDFGRFTRLPLTV